MRADVGPESTDTFHDAGEIHRGALGDIDAEAVRLADRGGGATGAQEGLGRDASDIETIAAHEMLFDQGDARAQTNGSGSSDQAGSAGTNDDEIVAARRSGVGPPGRMHIRDQFLVVTIPGLNGGGRTRDHEEGCMRCPVQESIRFAKERFAMRVTWIVTAMVAMRPTP